MTRTLGLFFGLIRCALRSRRDLLLENLALPPAARRLECKAPET
jgi:hypothetical protein